MVAKRLGAIAIAVVAAIVAWFVIESLFDVEMITPAMQGRPNMDISAVPIVLSVIVATLIGWGAMALVERRAQNPRRTWTTLAVVGTLLSLGAPFAGEGLDTTQRILLAVLHVVVAAVFIPLFARTAASRP
ncbi:MAG: DUF6069 family protein [Acidimicrobiia bacterium]